MGKEKAYGGKDLPKSLQVLSSEWKTEVVTDSGDGGESGGDKLPCATEGKGGFLTFSEGVRHFKRQFQVDGDVARNRSMDRWIRMM